MIILKICLAPSGQPALVRLRPAPLPATQRASGHAIMTFLETPGEGLPSRPCGAPPRQQSQARRHSAPVTSRPVPLSIEALCAAWAAGGPCLSAARAAPGWHEMYSLATVLVAHVTNLRRATAKLSPDDELLAYHRVTAAFDRALQPERSTVWKVSRYELPYYCAMSPSSNTPAHADAIVHLALRLLAAANEVVLPNGERAALQIGICTGATSAGIVGSECMSFIVTGPAAQAARELSDHPAALTIATTTWERLSDASRATEALRPLGAAAPAPAAACGGAGCSVDAVAYGGGAGCGAGYGAAQAPQGPEGSWRDEPCDGGCKRHWTLSRGFYNRQQEAEFKSWYDSSMTAYDQLVLLVSILSAAAALAQAAPSRQLPQGVALLGPGLVLLLLLRLAGRAFWESHREHICFAYKLLSLLLRLWPALWLGFAPAAAAAPAAVPGPLAAVAAAAAWLCAAAFPALVCKLRVRSQLILSALAVAATAAAAAGGGASSDAVLAAIASEAVRCGVVFAWDTHLRAAFACGGRGRTAAGVKAKSL